MVKRVIQAANIPATQTIFLVQQNHLTDENRELLNSMDVPCKIVPIDGVTAGAACTTLLAEEHIDNDEPLAIMNSDQLIYWDAQGGLDWFLEEPSDGGIVVFRDTLQDPKWSFARVEENWVTRVAEKLPISEWATAGIYVWKRGRDYVRCAKQMILNNERVNNEFYVCPVYNTAIREGLRFRTFSVREMHGLGTPEDLERYLQTQS